MPYRFKNAAAAALPDAELHTMFFDMPGQHAAWVFPTGRLVRLWERTYIRKVFAKTGQPVSPPHFTTLDSLLRRLFNATSEANSRLLISDAYRLALMDEATHNANLEFFSLRQEHLTLPMIEKLATVVNGLRKDGVSLQHIESDLANEEAAYIVDARKLHDIASVYREYLSLLNPKLCDMPEAVLLLNEFLERSTNEEKMPLFTGIKGLLFRGFSDFRQPELIFFSTLSSMPIPVIVELDYSPENGPLFGNIADIVEFLRTNKYTGEHDETTGRSIKELTPRQFLRRWLFNTEKPIEYPHFSETVSIMQTRDKIQETETVAKYVKHLIMKEGIHPSKICIATKNPDEYSGLFREIFHKYGIPGNITDRFTLANAPVTSAIFSLLEFISNGFRKKDLHKALLNRYLKFSRNDGSSIDRVSVLHCLDSLKIAGLQRHTSADYWIKQIERRIDSLRRKKELTMQYNFFDEQEIQTIDYEIFAMSKALEDLSTIFQALPNSSKLFSVDEFVRSIKIGFVKQLHIHEAIAELFAHISPIKNRDEIHYFRLEEEVEKDARALAEFLRIIDEFAFIYQERLGKQQKPLSYFYRRLRALTFDAKYQIREKHGYGVTVTSPEQTRGMTYDVSILCGALDGSFPEKYVPETFLGKELPETERRFIRKERMDFFQWMHNAIGEPSEHKKTVISYPMFLSEEAAAVRSPFVDALLRISTLERDNKILSLAGNSPTDAMTPEWANAVAGRMEYAMNFKKNTHDSPGYLLDPMIGKSLSEFGKISPQGKIKTEDFKNKPISVSALEDYAKCGYLFFANRMLRLSEDFSTELRLHTVERGAVVHAILFQFFSELKNSEIHPLEGIALNREKKDEYLQRLHQIANDALKQYLFDHPYFQLECHELLGSKEHLGLLEMWLNRELSTQNLHEEKPSIFEFNFGQRSTSDNAVAPIRISEKILLQGKIDRVDISIAPDGIFVVIADYKTGLSIPKASDIKKGISFQLPLYLAALNRYLEKNYNENIIPSGGAYLRLSKSLGNAKYYDDLAMPIKNDPEFHRETIQNSISYSENIVDNISQTIFPIQPLPKSCDYCSKKSLCRIGELNKYAMHSGEFV